MTDRRPPSSGLTCDEVRELAGSFVLGALDANEAAAVRVHLADCDDAHAEIQSLAEVVPVLAEAAPPVEPPADLKARLLAAAAADLETRGAAAPPTPFPSEAERSARRGPGAGTWLLRIAAVLGIAVLGGWNLLLQGQLQQARDYEQQVAAVLDVARQPGALTAVLTPAGGETGPAGLAALDPSGGMRLAMRGLTETTGTEVYEAWAIVEGADPQPLGEFTVGRDGTGSLATSGVPAQPGVVLALTREPGPDSLQPTTPVVAAGTAT